MFNRWFDSHPVGILQAFDKLSEQWIHIDVTVMDQTRAFYLVTPWLEY